MITLATLEEKTAQEVFDYIVAHLRKQGKKSFANGRCRYRYRGLRCAAGCLIGEDEYVRQMENLSWSNLVHLGLVPTDHLKHLISEMQHVHDRYGEDGWEYGSQEKAHEFNLTYTPPEEPQI